MSLMVAEHDDTVPDYIKDDAWIPYRLRTPEGRRRAAEIAAGDSCIALALGEWARHRPYVATDLASDGICEANADVVRLGIEQVADFEDETGLHGEQAGANARATLVAAGLVESAGPPAVAVAWQCEPAPPDVGDDLASAMVQAIARLVELQDFDGAARVADQLAERLRFLDAEHTQRQFDVLAREFRATLPLEQQQWAVVERQADLLRLRAPRMEKA